jgi:hypothetical protein
MTRTKMKAWTRRTYSHLQKRWFYQKRKEGVKSKKLARHKVNFQTPTLVLGSDLTLTLILTLSLNITFPSKITSHIVTHIKPKIKSHIK